MKAGDKTATKPVPNQMEGINTTLEDDKHRGSADNAELAVVHLGNQAVAEVDHALELVRG